MEPSIFDDLPSGQKPEEKDKEKEAKEISNLEKANKEAQSRVDRLKEDLKKKRDEEKKLKSGELSPDDDEKTEEKPKVEQDDIATAVKREIAARERREFETQVADEVRRIAQNKEEAEELYKMALEMPTTGVASVDVRVALAKKEELRKVNRGFSAPAFSGGFNDVGSKPEGRDFESLGYNQEQIEWFKKHGITIEQVKKHKDDVVDPFLFKRLGFKQ